MSSGIYKCECCKQDMFNIVISVNAIGKKSMLSGLGLQLELQDGGVPMKIMEIQETAIHLCDKHNDERCSQPHD